MKTAHHEPILTPAGVRALAILAGLGLAVMLLADNWPAIQNFLNVAALIPLAALLLPGWVWVFVAVVGFLAYFLLKVSREPYDPRDWPGHH